VISESVVTVYKTENTLITMNTKKFQSKLSKITTIFDSMQADHTISSLEQELLKKYVVQLYETLLDDPIEEEHKSQEKATQKIARKPQPKVETLQPKVEIVQTPPPPPKVAAPPVPEPIVSSATIAEPVIEKVAVAETIKQTVPVASSVATAKVASEVVANVLDMPAELQPIFEKIEATELSDRLSISKVKDIGKSMGINEKIFTIKELFAGDQSLFNFVVSKLDACTSYDEAAQYLSSTIARDQKWGDASKMNKAKTFVKLVQRKFV